MISGKENPIDARVAPGRGLSVINELVSLVNPVLFEPHSRPKGLDPAPPTAVGTRGILIRKGTPTEQGNARVAT